MSSNSRQTTVEMSVAPGKPQKFRPTSLFDSEWAPKTQSGPSNAQIKAFRDLLRTPRTVAPSTSRNQTHHRGGRGKGSRASTAPNVNPTTTKTPAVVESAPAQPESIEPNYGYPVLKPLAAYGVSGCHHH